MNPSPALIFRDFAPAFAVAVMVSAPPSVLISALEFLPTSTVTSLGMFWVPLYTSAPPRLLLLPASAPAF